MEYACGVQEQCSAAPDCSPARQLLVMETEELMQARDRNRLTYSGRQCRDALKKGDIFNRCEVPATDSDSETPVLDTPPDPSRSVDPIHR